MCTSEIAHWRLNKLKQYYRRYYDVRDWRDVFILAFINQEVECDPGNANEQYVRFLVRNMLGEEIDLPTYVNDAYFKIPLSVRLVATAD